MKTDNLIEKLAAELTPVSRLWPFWARYALWIAAVSAAITALLAITGLRRTFLPLHQNLWDLLELGLLAVLLAVAGWGALRHSVPGESSQFQKFGPITLFAGWAVMTISRVVASAAGEGPAAIVPDSHSICADIIAITSIVIWAGTIIALRRAAPQDLRWAGVLSGLASSAAAAVGTQFFCIYERPAHILAWHVAPIALICAAGALAGPLLFQPRTRFEEK